MKALIVRRDLVSILKLQLFVVMAILDAGM